jgi:hypothetical protein
MAKKSTTIPLPFGFLLGTILRVLWYAVAALFKKQESR